MTKQISLMLRNLLLGSVVLVSTAVVAYKIGSRTAEVKTCLICDLDDISTLIALKDKFNSDESKSLKKVLRDRYVWRYEGIKFAYSQTLYRYPISLDKDIDKGILLMEKRIKEFDSD